MSSLPGFKCKERRSDTALQIIQRNGPHSMDACMSPKSLEDEDKGIMEILMLQQRTVLQVKLLQEICRYLNYITCVMSKNLIAHILNDLLDLILEFFNY